MFVFRIVAKSYLDNKGVVVQKFGTNNLSGDDWARSLFKRHKMVGQRIATNISKVRADVSPLIINEYSGWLILYNLLLKRQFLIIKI